MRIAVVGLGHIGLPLAVQYASRGHDVLGVDVDARDRRGASTAASRRTATSRRSSIGFPSCMPPAACARRPGRTRPAFARGGGDRRHRAGGGRRGARDRLRADRRGHARHRAPTRAAARSSSTRRRCRSARPATGSARCSAEGSGLELDRDLFLAFSPERVLVGRVFLDLRRYPKIVGGTSAESTRRAVELLPAVARRGDRGPGGGQRRDGRDDEAGRDHVPRREHRLRQRAARATPRGAGST